jgi:signal transduction histidine kinase
MGFEVHATSDPADAVYAARGGRFDVALLDLGAESVGGVTLTEAVHGHQPGLPVLVMTSCPTVQTAIEAGRCGACDLLAKPFGLGELRQKIQKALAARRWAHDRDRLMRVAQVLAVTGCQDRICQVLAQATVESTEAEHCLIFQFQGDRLVPRGEAGPRSCASHALEAAAHEAVRRGEPMRLAWTDARTLVVLPLLVEREPTGALVVETAEEPDGEDLELLTMFSTHAAMAVQTAHELERLRSGALAALGRVASQVAHDLKNPMAGIRLYARYLTRHLEATGDDEGGTVARRLCAAVEDLSVAVDESLAFGRPAEIHPVPTPLHPLLEDCILFARARCSGRAHEVVRGYDPGCPSLQLDPREIRKAFLNLILNGLEAMEGAGRLTICTKLDRERRVVAVMIEDTGVGMDDDVLSRAFDLFFTTKPRGTGLGMAIARSVVMLHGGDLSVRSSPGNGTIVTVQLPAPADASAEGRSRL